MLFVLEASGDALERRPRSGPPALLAHRHGGTLAEVRVNGPAPAPLPPYIGPPIVQSAGPPNLELVVGTGRRSQPITPILTLRGHPAHAPAAGADVTRQPAARDRSA
jgi:hypothetical protein